MFRTRDFLLVFVTIVFLIVAIGATVIQQHGPASIGSAPPTFAIVTNDEYVADVYVPEVVSREDRLAAMKDKIEASESMILSAPTSDEDTAVAAVTSEEADDNVSPISSLTCGNPPQYTKSWPAFGLQLEMIEGARIVYREVITESQLDPLTASSGTLLPPETSKEVLAQLPVRSVPDNQSHCPMYDVIGIAKDGSLIKNNEAGLYGVFDSDTVVGYALDGFPIHGSSDVQTDACGGVVVDGQYRYYLATDRVNVLNCFAATPIIF